MKKRYLWQARICSYLMWLITLLILNMFCGCFATVQQRTHGERPQIPAENILRSAHSHNDYQHYPKTGRRYGFSSLEVDVHLVDGTLYVAHDKEDIKEWLTFKDLYLVLLNSESSGRSYSPWLFAEKQPLTLLIDIKSDSVATYNALMNELETVKPFLTTFSSSEIVLKPLLIIISGNRAKQRMLQDSLRYAAYDGRLSDLDKAYPPNFVYWISDNWEKNFQWRGEGQPLESEIVKLRELANRAHQRGAKLRFWKTPEKDRQVRERIWNLLLSCGVDILSTDNMKHLSDFLRAREN
ncbi:MAG: hypothetical protein ACRBF0_19360 [Calditrichia bacterium]